MKTVVITGGSSGIGQAITGSLKAEGWQVINMDHSVVDLSNTKTVETFLANLIVEIGEVDALVHVAGVWHDDREVFAGKSLDEYKLELIADTMAVGVTSLMLIAAALIPRLKKNGVVVGISGTFESGAKGWLPYYTSKRALEDFLVGLSQDNTNLRSFCVSPADTATPAYKKFFPEHFETAQSPNEVANLCKKLLAGNSKYKSGAVIEIREDSNRPGFHK